MSKKTRFYVIFIAAVAVLVAAAAGVMAYLAHQNRILYEATYIVIDGTEYERAATSLDLSGSSIGELDKLKELTEMEKLDLRDTEITTAQYDDLKAALPDCDITWSAPFQGASYDSDSRELTISTLAESDLDALVYFPKLEKVLAYDCTEYELLAELGQRFSQVEVIYNVKLGGSEYETTATSLTLENADLGELLERLGYFPNMETVKLTGTVSDMEQMLTLKESFPEVIFDFDFQIVGVSVNSLDEKVDLSGIKVENVEDVETFVPYFYNLSQVDMVNCGLDNETMDALNKRHMDVKFVWGVSVCGVYLRTDATYFMPYQYNLKSAAGSYNLRYCTDMVALDFGHYKIGNVDFVQYMPNLKYLLLCDCVLTDLYAIGTCTSLEYIELQGSPRLSDFWPLTNLTNLKDLNLGSVNYRDCTPLLQMTWLDRLWMSCLKDKDQEMLREALPNTVIVFGSGGTLGGFRYTPGYYGQRDAMGMFYNAN